MAADKRKIGYFGDKENLKTLEDELYHGMINSDEAFKKRAEELGISIKITDDASKLKIVGNCVRGEVSTKGTFETKRRRIYGTTNGFQLVELLGSEVSSRKAGETGIIIFGNNFAKKMAESLISKKFKPSSSLKAKGEQFEEFDEMDDAFVRSIFLTPMPSAQAAFDAAFAKHGPSASVIAMPFGGATLPVLR